MEHRVTVNLPSSPATTMVLGAVGTAMAYVGVKRIVQQPAKPEPGYHPHVQNDPLAGAILLAGGAVFVVLSARRFYFMRDAL